MTFLKFSIVGKPNVGKSTIFNKLCGKKLAITSKIPGVTRDRKEYAASLGDLNFTLIDTAGWENEKKSEIKSLMMEQTKIGIEDSDIVLFVIDARKCLSADDLEIAKLVRRHNKPTILIANKSESKIEIADKEIYSFGFNSPIFISAEHSMGFSDLYDAIRNIISSNFSHVDQVENWEKFSDLSIAIAGKPNVGKSTIFNKLLGYERNIVYSESGTTRDAISHQLKFKGRNISLIDTAGMRKKSKIHEEVESISSSQAITAIRRANVVALIIDVTQPLERQDLSIIQVSINEGKGLLIVFNKCDLIDNIKEVKGNVDHFLKNHLKTVSNISTVYCTAIKGRNVDKIIDSSLLIQKSLDTKLTTGIMNQWLKDVTTKHLPPVNQSGRRLKFKYMTQISVRPPTFKIFTNISTIPKHYEKYLSNELRADFNLDGVPIRIQFKASENPYS